MENVNLCPTPTIFSKGPHNITSASPAGHGGSKGHRTTHSDRGECGNCCGDSNQHPHQVISNYLSPPFPRNSYLSPPSISNLGMMSYWFWIIHELLSGLCMNYTDYFAEIPKKFRACGGLFQCISQLIVYILARRRRENFHRLKALYKGKCSDFARRRRDFFCV